MTPEIVEVVNHKVLPQLCLGCTWNLLPNSLLRQLLLEILQSPCFPGEACTCLMGARLDYSKGQCLSWLRMLLVQPQGPVQGHKGRETVPEFPASSMPA